MKTILQNVAMALLIILFAHSSSSAQATRMKFAGASESLTRVEEQTIYCTLAYDYSPATGQITCRNTNFEYYTFYIHPAARRNRRLFQGMRLIVIFEPMYGYGSGAWKRIYFRR